LENLEEKRKGAEAQRRKVELEVKRRQKKAILAVALMILPFWAMAQETHQDGWFQFRGPNRDGKSTEIGLIRTWDDAGPRELWRIPIGAGFSSISVVGEYLYTMDSDDEQEFALCLDATDGSTVWRVPVGSIFKDINGDGPRSAPTVDGNLVFVMGSRGRLAALEAATGDVVWDVEISEAFGSELPTWAFSTAPLVEGDLLIAEVGGTGDRAIAAFDKKTGDVRWTSQEANLAYSSPIRVEYGGVRQFVFLLQQKIVALDRNGEQLWSVPFAPDLDIKPASPVFIAPDLILVAASYDTGAKVVRLRSENGSVTAEEAWTSRFMRSHFNSAVELDGFLYGFDAATLRAMNAQTGERGWAKRGLGKGSLIYADGMFIVLSERGKLLLLEATSSGYRELASHQVLKGRCWTQPTLWKGRLYLRNHTEMVCLDFQP
jgi:hypothetical protein